MKAGGRKIENVDERPQRLRITYRKAGSLRYIAHLDLMRAWERALRRAKLPLAYTQGFSPHARLALGAALAVGTVGERELLDVWMSPAIAPAEVVRRLAPVLPDGLEVRAAEEVPAKAPSLESEIRGATYEVTFEPSDVDAAELRGRVAALMALPSLDWEETRGNKTRRYDLRATIRELTVREERQGVVLALDLEQSEGRTGRPASVLAALAVEARPARTVRTGLRLAEEEAPAARGEGAR